MNTPLISVIIPVYNVSKYLQRCIDSLLRQSYKNLEFIFVEDKSTDNSLEILKLNLKRDARIRIIENRVNSGLSFSRNAGLKVARGELIGFVDSDDFVKQTMYESLLSCMMSENVDISCCGIIRYDEATGAKKEILTPKIKKVFTPEDALENVFLQKDIGYSAYSKLFRRELFDNCEFPIDGSFEDIPMWPIIFRRAKKIAHTASAEYYYVTRESSITTATVSEKNLIIYPRIKKIEEEIKEYYPNIYSSFEYMRIVNYSNLYVKALRDSIPQSSELFITIKNNYLNIYPNVMANPHLSFKDRLRLILLKFGIYKK